MALNFNVDPYYDDFDPSKNFHRILFKPGVAVQARELTQSQTILQSQISKFAENIFKQNTPVTGGKVTTNLSCSYIKLNNTYLGSDVIASRFLNKTITNAAGTVIAKVIKTAEKTGTDNITGDPPTLIVNYFSGVQFTDDELLRVIDEPNIAATTVGTAGGTTCTGLSSVASIAEGVFYVVNGFSTSSIQNEDGTFSKYSIGNFVSVQPQTVILSKYDITPSLRVGLSITESIVDYISDTSLLDPAIGASNYQAPGADRYKISLDLITLPLATGNDDQFIELLRIEGGQILKQVDGTSYSLINDYFAKRDYETNGDYIVNDFKIIPSTTSSDSNVYDLRIGKGVAYVQGYRIENQGDLVLTNTKARDTEAVIGNNIFVDYGNYFYVDNVHGFFDVTTLPEVELHCVPSEQINSANASTYNSTLVGTGLIRNLTYVSDSGGSNTRSYVFKSYISDIDTNTLSGNASIFSSQNTLAIADDISEFSMTTDAYVGATIVITNGTSVGDIRRVTSYNAATKTVTVDRDFTLAPDGTSEFSLIFDTTVVESIVQRTSSVSYTLKANSNIDSTFGKENGVVTGDTIFYNPQTPELIFNVGDSYVSSLSNTSYFSTKVFRNKTFTNLGGASSITLIMPAGGTLRFQGSGTLSGDAVKQLFTVIDTSTKQILDFSSNTATVSITSGGTSATLTSAAAAGKTVNVIVNGVFISNADTTNFVLKSKNLVVGNTSIVSTAGPSGIINSQTYVDLPNGQVYIKKAAIDPLRTSLYVTDVKSIIRVIDTLDPAVAPTVDMLTDDLYDATNLFTLDNGQRDTYYDHASLSLVPGANFPKGNLLVIFDYYAHSGGDGYFSVRSYLSAASGGVSTSPENYAEIGTYVANDGTNYNLTDAVDFRPARQNAQANFIFDYTGNPTTDDTGVLIPDNLSSFISDYNYYLARKDKLVLTKDKEFLIVNGSPAINAILPVEPAGSLVLAELNHDPYTAYIPGQNPKDKLPNLSINKVSNRRWTMNDITGLQTRIENLEYYTALNLLEQSAQSLQVPDANGLNRFKNGILVDDFSSYSVADTFNPNFSTNINVRKKQLMPLTDVQNFQLQNPIVLNSLGTVTETNNYKISSINNSQTNIFTLPYTSRPVITQSLASNVLSVNPFSVIDQLGVLTLNPPIDNWVDASLAPYNVTNNTGYQIFQSKNGGLNVLNAGDFASVIGVSSATQNPITSASLIIDNGYYINPNVLPYIRPQQTLVRAKGLLTNTPISCWFDGVNVDQYMTSPNVIELTGVVGTFKEDDIIGFYYSNKFYYVGKVVSVNVQSAGVVRLYVMNIGGFLYAPTGVKLQNAKFDSNGNYSTFTASGNISTTTVQSIHRSGTLSGVGGSYTANNIVGSATIYKVTNPNGWGTFLNQYGVWGNLQYDSQGNSTTPYNASFVVDIPQNGNYTLMVSSSGSAITSINSSPILTTSNPTTVSTSTQTLTSGQVTVSWAATNSSGPAGYALVIKNSAGNIIFQSDKPTNITFDSVARSYNIANGGFWFTRATKVQLDPNASNIPNYYVGSRIQVTSTYVASVAQQSATFVTPVPPPPPPPPCTRQVENRIGYKISDMLNDPALWNKSYAGAGFTSGPPPGSSGAAAASAVANVYRNYLGRYPDTGGAVFWTSSLISGRLNFSNFQEAILSAARTNGTEVIYPAGDGGAQAVASAQRAGIIAGDFNDRPDVVTYRTVPC